MSFTGSENTGPSVAFRQLEAAARRKAITARRGGLADVA